ncbi:hypothetical protein ACA910_000642 [Epithemia clementina (nom. ined.)]
MLSNNPYGSVKTQKLKPTTTSAAVPSTTSDERNRVCQKRPERPWDGEPTATAAATVTAAALENSQISNPSSSGKIITDDFDSFFDGDDGFDWAAAVQCVDAAVTNSAMGLSQQPSGHPSSIHSEQSSPRSKENLDTTNSSSSLPTRPVSVHQIHDQKRGMDDDSVSAAPPPPTRTTTSISTKLVPGVAPGQNTLKSLRPELWRSTKKNSLQSNDQPIMQESPLSQPDQFYGDTRQKGLPKELCFNPKCTEPVEDGNLKTLIAHANLASPLKNGWELFPHQVQAIKQCLAMRRFILALDMGLGKTLIGCVWASAFLQTSLLQCKRAFVLCPVSLKTEWKRTAEEATGLEVTICQDMKAMPKTSNTRGKTQDMSSSDEDDDDDDKPTVAYSRVSIHSWAKVPSPPDEGNFIVVADEAHSIQSMQAARTRSTLELVLHKRCIGVLLLSGTPMKNGKPSNLFPLLKAVRHPLGRNQRAYESHFCEGRKIWFGKSRSVWQATGSSNLDQLRALTKSHLLYLSKDDCINLPRKTRVYEKVPVSRRKQLQYDQGMQELIKVYQSCKGGDSDAVLGGVQSLRMVGSFAKVDATVHYAKKILEDEPSIVIFTSFVEPARMLHQKLADSGWSGELLTGETPTEKRQQMVDNFQKHLSPVFICTFGAGGVGLTLTAARTIILMDRPWTPGDAHQAEDRVLRIGQKYPVKSIWMRAFELDERIDDMLEQKSQTSSTVLIKGTDGSPTTKGKDEVLQQKQQRVSIYKLLDEILKDKKPGLKQTSIMQFSQPSE